MKKDEFNELYDQAQKTHKERIDRVIRIVNSEEFQNELKQLFKEEVNNKIEFDFNSILKDCEKVVLGIFEAVHSFAEIQKFEEPLSKFKNRITRILDYTQKARDELRQSPTLQKALKYLLKEDEFESHQKTTPIESTNPFENNEQDFSPSALDKQIMALKYIQSQATQNTILHFKLYGLPLIIQQVIEASTLTKHKARFIISSYLYAGFLRTKKKTKQAEHLFIFKASNLIIEELQTIYGNASLGLNPFKDQESIIDLMKSKGWKSLFK